MSIQDSDDRNEAELFLVLDGGGARGIAHVAMWRGLQELVAKPKEKQPELPDEYGDARYRLAGVAGTSAGAIAATFIAAGASADDLIDTSGRSPLCAALGLGQFHDIFGIRGWRRLKHIRRIIKPPAKLRMAAELLDRDIAAFRRQTSGEGSPVINLPEGNFGGKSRESRDGQQSHNSAEKSDLQPDPDIDAYREANPYTIEPLHWFVGCAALSPLLVSIARPYAFPSWPAPYSLLLLIGIGYLTFAASSRLARYFERNVAGPRSFNWWQRGLAHPLASLIYTLLLARLAAAIVDANIRDITGLAQALNIKTWFPRFFEEVYRPHYLLRALTAYHLPSAYSPAQVVQFSMNVLAWSLCAGLAAYTFIRILRDFIKGGVDTDRIESDFNRAIRVILTQRCKGWNEIARAHRWEDRPGLTQKQRQIRDDPSHKVTFSELFEVTNIHLSVVAADTIENRVCIYSTTTHPDMPVAKVVSASLAIPFAFRYVREEDRLLVDGGLVSTIPAWVFRRHRNRDPDCKILAIRIEPGRPDDWIPKFLDYRKLRTERIPDRKSGRMTKLRFFLTYRKLAINWPFGLFSNILTTALFGGRSLELDASDRLESVSLAPRIGLLDFDANPKQIATECESLQRIAIDGIIDRLWLRQKAFNFACAEIEGILLSVHGRASRSDLSIRIYWAKQDGIANSLRIRRTYNFSVEHHVDDRLVMPFGTSMSALAFQTGKAQFALKETLADLRSGRMNRYRDAAKWKEIAWCWAIPVSLGDKSEHPGGVLAIESNVPLAQFSDEVGEEAARRAARWPKPLKARKMINQPIERQNKYLQIAGESGSEAKGRMLLWERHFTGIIREYLERADEVGDN